MRAAQYIFINDGLAMSPGKIAAQAAHAAVEAYRITAESANNLNRDAQDLLDNWYEGGHYMKLVMRARDTEHLLTIERYLKERGFKTALIIDEGRTEIAAHTPTALGVALVDKDDPHTEATFSTFELLKPRQRTRLTNIDVSTPMLPREPPNLEKIWVRETAEPTERPEGPPTRSPWWRGKNNH